RLVGRLEEIEIAARHGLAAGFLDHPDREVRGPLRGGSEPGRGGLGGEVGRQHLGRRQGRGAATRAFARTVPVRTSTSTEKLSAVPIGWAAARTARRSGPTSRPRRAPSTVPSAAR